MHILRYKFRCLEKCTPPAKWGATETCGIIISVLCHKNSRFHQKTDVFLTFWRLQKLQPLRLGAYLGFTPVVDSVFLTFWLKMIFGVKQHFWEKVPESCIQNGKTPFSLYNSVEYSEYSRLFDILERWNLGP